MSVFPGISREKLLKKRDLEIITTVEQRNFSKVAFRIERILNFLPWGAMKNHLSLHVLKSALIHVLKWPNLVVASFLCYFFLRFYALRGKSMTI